jgi:hypothetical protein
MVGSTNNGAVRLPSLEEASVGVCRHGEFQRPQDQDAAMKKEWSATAPRDGVIRTAVGRGVGNK